MHHVGRDPFVHLLPRQQARQDRRLCCKNSPSLLRPRLGRALRAHRLALPDGHRHSHTGNGGHLLRTPHELGSRACKDCEHLAARHSSWHHSELNRLERSSLRGSSLRLT